MKRNNYYKELNLKILSKKCLVGVVGIGYVGIQLLIQFSKKKIKTLGFDRDFEKIKFLKKGKSPYSYIKNKDIKILKKFTSFENNFDSICKCDVIIICLPTPVKKNTKPDLSNIRNAFAEIYKNMSRKTVTVEEFREAQEILKSAIDLHEKKDF